MEKHTVQKIENAAIGIVFGAAPIIICFVAGWWISIPFVPEARIWLCALAGLLLGILIDGLFLRDWVRRAYSMKTWVWIAVYGLYSIGMYGLFMGFPVFNAILALPAGVFVGRWLVRSNADSDHIKKVTRRSAIFTTGVLGVACIASAVLALGNSSTGADIQGMLGFPFQVTPATIVGIILVGGVMILAFEWWLTVKSVAWTCRYFVAYVKSSSG